MSELNIPLECVNNLKELVSVLTQIEGNAQFTLGEKPTVTKRSSSIYLEIAAFKTGRKLEEVCETLADLANKHQGFIFSTPYANFWMTATAGATKAGLTDYYLGYLAGQADIGSK